MTLAVFLQFMALVVPVAAVLGGVYSARSLRKKTAGETEKVRQETRDLVDAAVRKQAEFLTDEIAGIRQELIAERLGRRDCDKHLAETTQALNKANRRIDSQDLMIQELNYKITDLNNIVQTNTQAIKDNDQSGNPEPTV